MVEVLVEYDYQAEQEDELTIKKGDIIKNVVMSDGGWWEGELSGKKGMFPDNFVKVMDKNNKEKKNKDDTPVQASKRTSVKLLADKIKDIVQDGPGQTSAKKKDPVHQKKRAKVLFSYEPENEDELKLELGDIVDVIRQAEDGWYEGSVNGKTGVFPSNFVEVLSEENEQEKEEEDKSLIKGKKIIGVGLGNIFGSGPIKLRSTGGSAKQVLDDKPTENKDTKPPNEEAVLRRPKTGERLLEKAVVRYSYTAENEDELTLNEGEIISVLDKELEDSGWWKGEINGRIGVFPDNFVEIMKEESSAEHLNKVPQPTSSPHPEPKPKKPPPPGSVKQAPRLPDKVPVADTSKADVKDEKSIPPTLPLKKPIFPPPVGKKPSKPELQPTKPTEPEKPVEEKKETVEQVKKESNANSFDSIESTSDKLIHLTASRAKGPSKRPPSQEDERNGDVKDLHGIKEEKPSQPPHPQPSGVIGFKKEESPKSLPPIKELPKEKPQQPPARPPEPTAAANPVSQSALEELRREMRDLKASMVSKTAFNELKAENEQLKNELEHIKNLYSRRFKDIMQEIDDEKKIRLSTQVEMERIRKLVTESNV
ncbi:hypothetical protein CHS0354_010940 [Potamilus streckersoni]|uniref:SH3 domain-containing protein n=1 Tax=Potamilus streckersoni TaxID=2493646 RepID=A0AAE0SSM8_9BIVA|nr:hypothetical protein CHS0354_010940 [Potamilus streckersoni]